jgi:hypothetical protein|tara:strand:- start:14417 stop:15742 length:1326 start_codon:yes stop_codon:yes gene_type:complete
VEHTRLRRRVLYNLHEQDIVSRLTKTVGNVRREAWPPPDLTANPARHVFSQLAGLYRQVPEVMPPEGGELAAAAMSEAGYWQLATRVQRDTLGLNNSLVHLSIVEGEPVYRLVWPDMVQVEVDPRQPSIVVAVREWSIDPDDPSKWVTLVTDPRTPSYRALDASGNDVSDRVLGGAFAGDSYPWWTDAGAVLPYVAYSSAETGYAFDAYSGAEVFEGSLQLGVYYTMLAHTFADASWAQRYAIGAEPVGLDSASTGRRAEIVTDPATLLLLRQADDSSGQPVVGQWTSPVDPSSMLSAIERYERRIVEMALGTVGVSRRESDVRSAASLAVSREAQREAQRSYEPLFRRSDLQLIRLTAGLLGAPVDGWRITYKSLPKDPNEQAAELQSITTRLEAGLLDKVSAYMELHPGLTREEAREALMLVRLNDAELGSIMEDTPDA